MFEFAAMRFNYSLGVQHDRKAERGVGFICVYSGLVWGYCGVGPGIVHELLRVVLEFVQERFRAFWIYACFRFGIQPF